MQQIQVTIKPGENFTAASLMRRYVDRTPGAQLIPNRWGEYELTIKGTVYLYHHWSVSGEVVTLYLLEADRYRAVNPMCRGCLRLAADCQGTTEKVWTGCTGRVIE